MSQCLDMLGVLVDAGARLMRLLGQLLLAYGSNGWTLNFFSHLLLALSFLLSFTTLQLYQLDPSCCKSPGRSLEVGVIPNSSSCLQSAGLSVFPLLPACHRADCVGRAEQQVPVLQRHPAGAEVI